MQTFRIAFLLVKQSPTLQLDCAKNQKYRSPDHVRPVQRGQIPLLMSRNV
jgi:hypothetical protein